MNLKDEYNTEFINDLAVTLFKERPSFNKDLFVSKVLNKDWSSKELKERMRWITECLHNHLPISYKEQIEILKEVAPNYRGLRGMIFPDFVQVYGLEYFELSTLTMELFTEFSTSEFAIRPFIERYPTKTLDVLNRWSKSKNNHVRRLASEGSRPKLPWAPPLRGFIDNPKPILPILEALKNDESEYVRKSVANHLNDISKSQPKLVLSIAEKWYGKTTNTNWVVKHALRTLLKKGDKRALAIFGLENSKGIELSEITLSKKEICIGDFVHFEFELTNGSTYDRNVRVEYKVAYVKANGSTSNKVFQISEFVLKNKAQKQFKRKQWFKELSTRKHYVGIHKITLIVNGDEKGSISLVLRN